MTMLRSSSPAMSEISVGSPSPPLLHSSASASNGFHVLNIKRLRSSVDTIPTHPTDLQFLPPLALPQRRKSSVERVKSFSIADILGKKEQEEKVTDDVKSNTAPPLPLKPATTSLLNGIPSTHTITPHILVERLHPVAPPPLPLAAPAPSLMLDLPILHKVIPTTWDPATNLASTTAHPSLPIHHLFPPALLHYEQRLAWDYQRQLQEHFQAQAQLLRQMSMDPNIIPSEDGSERSRSSSAGSRCYSPEVNVAEDDDDDVEGEEEESLDNSSKTEGRLNADRDKNTGGEKGCDDNRKKSANDTPLDALFQLSTKNFDEDQDPATLSIFATRPNPKKKRKSRTAFTNHQIFELEKRFLYQKYLSPADRDEIAAGLGLSNAQVITWFQNRRAKLKRDMEELKKDVESVKQLHDQSADISSRQHQQPCSIPTMRKSLQQRIHMATILRDTTAAQHQQQHLQEDYQHNRGTYYQHNSCHSQSSSTLTLQHQQPQQLQETRAMKKEMTSATQAEVMKNLYNNSNNKTVTSKSTTVEDKKDIKLLKMFTLIHYTQESKLQKQTYSNLKPY